MRLAATLIIGHVQDQNFAIFSHSPSFQDNAQVQVSTETGAAVGNDLEVQIEVAVDIGKLR